MREKKIRIYITLCVVFILLGVLFIPKVLYANTSINKTKPVDAILSPYEMLEDLDQLEKYIKRVHPSSKSGLDEDVSKAIQNAYEKIDKPMTVGEYYFLLNEIVCKLGDAHTSIGVSGVNRIINVPIEYVEDKVVCTSESNVLKPGDIIVKLGDKDIDECIEYVKNNIPAENIYWQNMLSPHYLKRELYLSRLGLIEDDKVTITYKRDVKELKTTLPLEEVSYNQDNSFVECEIYADEKTGIITIDKCLYNDEYKETLSNAFLEYASSDIDTLVIDVRKNTGGSSRCLDELISYINVDEYKSYIGLIRGSWDGWIQRSSLISHKTSNGIRKNTKKDSSLLFDGEIYVLTSGYTFSSGNWFGVILKDNNLAKIVGEPTGNKPTSYGDILRFPLDNSGIYLNMSYKEWLRPDTDKDNEDSLYPDVLIEKTIEDVINSRDAVLEYILNN